MSVRHYPEHPLHGEVIASRAAAKQSRHRFNFILSECAGGGVTNA